MKTIKALLDSHIQIPVDSVPSGFGQRIVDDLTLDNKAKEEAIRRHVMDADKMPDFIQLWDEVDDEVLLPRGYAFRLVELAERYDIEIEWLDMRVKRKGFKIGNEIPLRDYQIKVVEAIMDVEQGIVKAPTGAGKTVAALAIVRLTPSKSIVIVNTKEIAQQWIDRARQWLGEDFPVSMIGDGEWDISGKLVVAIQASLWSRREELAQGGFFHKFTTAILDECHHATADTYRYIFDKFESTYRFGMSATPEKTGDFRIAEAIIGPVVVEVTEDDVAENILRPEVQVIQTQFGARYKGDKVMSNGWVRRNNYASVLKKLVTDEDRNALIACEIIDNHRGNANLVLSKQLKHLDLIRRALIDAGYPEEGIFNLTGKESREERKSVVERTEDGSCVVLSTLADEALDAPRLDRLHITFPTKNADLVRQQVGRIRRKHPDKADAIVIDYRDMQVAPLERQYLTRRHDCYNQLGFTVTKRKDKK